MCVKCFCGKIIPEERLEFGFTTCLDCSKESKPIGFMVYGHKTAGEIVIIDSKDSESVRQAHRAHRRDR